MPADASAAATDRPEPSASADVARREVGVTVPPPRSAPAVEAEPARPAGDRTASAPPTGTPADDPSVAGAPVGAPSPAGTPVGRSSAAGTPVGGSSVAGTPADVPGATASASGELGVAPAVGGPAGAVPDAEGAPGELTERERQILAFEQRWWKHAGAKEQAIRDTFGLSATRYYQLLNGLLDHPAALAAEPVLIGRLRRLRSSRARNRRR